LTTRKKEERKKGRRLKGTKSKGKEFIKVANEWASRTEVKGIFSTKTTPYSFCQTNLPLRGETGRTTSESHFREPGVTEKLKENGGGTRRKRLGGQKLRTD